MKPFFTNLASDVIFEEFMRKLLEKESFDIQMCCSFTQLTIEEMREKTRELRKIEKKVNKLAH